MECLSTTATPATAFYNTVFATSTTTNHLIAAHVNTATTTVSAICYDVVFFVMSYFCLMFIYNEWCLWQDRLMLLILVDECLV